MITDQTPLGEVLPRETIEALAALLSAGKTGTVMADVKDGVVRAVRWQAPIVALGRKT